MAPEFGNWLKSHLQLHNLAQQNVALEFIRLARTEGGLECSYKTTEPLLARLLRHGDAEARRHFLSDAARMRWLAAACGLSVKDLVQHAPREWNLHAVLQPVVVVDAAAVALGLGIVDFVDGAQRVVALLEAANPSVDFVIAVPFQADLITLAPESQKSLDDWRAGGRLVEPAREGEDAAAKEVWRRREQGQPATRLGGDTRDMPRWHRLRLEVRNGTPAIVPSDFAQRLRQPEPPVASARPLLLGPDRYRVVVRHAGGKDPPGAMAVAALPPEVRVFVDDMLQGYDVREHLEELGWQWSPRKGRLYVPMDEQSGKHLVIEHEVFQGGDSLEWRQQFLPHGAETTATREDILQLLPPQTSSGPSVPYSFRGQDRITTMRLLSLLHADAMGWWDCTDGPLVVNADGLRSVVEDERVLFGSMPPPEAATRTLVLNTFPLSLLSQESGSKPSRALQALLGEAVDDPVSSLAALMTVQDACDRWLKDDNAWCLLTPAEVRAVLGNVMAAACELRMFNDVSFTVHGEEVLQRPAWVARPLGNVRIIEQWMQAAAAFEEQRFLVGMPPSVAIVARSTQGPAYFTFRGMRYAGRKRQPTRLFFCGERIVADAGDLVLDVIPGWRTPAFTMDPLTMDETLQRTVALWTGVPVKKPRARVATSPRVERVTSYETLDEP